LSSSKATVEQRFITLEDSGWKTPEKVTLLAGTSTMNEDVFPIEN